MISTGVSVDFVTDNPKEIPLVGAVKMLRVNGHRQKMRIASIKVEEQWIWADDEDKQYPTYRGTIEYEVR